MNMEKKRKKPKILLVVLLLLAAALGAVVWWQWGNLKALYLAGTMDAETILEKETKQREKYQQELKQYGVELIAPSRQEMDALLNGEDISKEAEAEVKAESAPTEEADAAGEIIARCVQELYDCETALMAKLGGMKQAAIEEWKALPAEEQTEEKKMALGMRGLDGCYVLEVEIDAQVQAILDRYRAELKAIGADTAPMNTLWEYYCEEKASTKAYYLNKYF